jgi:hypothetical protein
VQDTLNRAIDQMPRRLAMAIKAKGLMSSSDWTKQSVFRFIVDAFSVKIE